MCAQNSIPPCLTTMFIVEWAVNLSVYIHMYVCVCNCGYLAQLVTPKWPVGSIASSSSIPLEFAVDVCQLQGHAEVHFIVDVESSDQRCALPYIHRLIAT